MMNNGYFQYPISYKDTLFFISEENLWEYNPKIKKSYRLTFTKGEIKYPIISESGNDIVFNGREEGDEDLFLLNRKTGLIQRLTYLASNIIPIQFYDNDKKIIFTSNFNQPFNEIYFVYSLDLKTNQMIRLNYGNARFIAFKDNVVQNEKVVVQQLWEESAYWKRYKGGTIGKFWIKRDKNTKYVRFLDQLQSNVSNPMWFEDYLYFLSDHEGIANIYRCGENGENIEKLTDHTMFYVRNPSFNKESREIYYQCGGDIFSVSIVNIKSRKVNLSILTTRPFCQPKYINPDNYIQGYHISYDGKKICFNIRGKVAVMNNWHGPVSMITKKNNIRDSIPVFLSNDNFLSLVSDELKEERITLVSALSQEPYESRELLSDWDFGHILSMQSCSAKNIISVTNHKNELFAVDFDEKLVINIDHSEYGEIIDPVFSPDGRFMAYSYPISFQKNILKIFSFEKKESYPITEGLGYDFNPSFSPDGKYLLFISGRNFDPVSDILQFEISFPFGLKPYLIVLNNELPNPFIFSRIDFEEEDESAALLEEIKNTLEKSNEKSNGKTELSPDEENNEKGDSETLELIQSSFAILKSAKKKSVDKNTTVPKKKEKKPENYLAVNDQILMNIDFEGIENRILELPVQGGFYTKIQSNAEKIFFLYFPTTGVFEEKDEINDYGFLYTYDLKTKSTEIFLDGVFDFELTDAGQKIMIVTSEGDFRVIQSGEKPTEGFEYNPKDGYINLDRIKIYVDPRGEWEQMFDEAWRLQRDYFWNENYIKQDWENVYTKYKKLLSKIGTRSEFSDLVQEMQGELGTSHCYEYGGDRRIPPYYKIGFLGVDLTYDRKLKTYRITKIYKGDPWIENRKSPLLSPGINVKEEDYILEVDGRKLDLKNPLNKYLKNKSQDYIDLIIGCRESGEQKSKEIMKKHVYLKTLKSDFYIRYRDWVDTRRETVHKKSNGMIGYLHIPDMQYFGYSEFHKYFLKEMSYKGLIVDIRYNRGGFVSELIIEKLSRKIIGYDFTRWITKPEPYPSEAPLGPIIFLANEYTGSDGDIFANAVKILKIGKLVGTRTWGGVIGIAGRGYMIDGSMTTQPEFAFWFNDVGWNVENYGVDPDITVDISPEAWNKDYDSQLDRSISLLMNDVKKLKTKIPKMRVKKNRDVPTLSNVKNQGIKKNNGKQ